MGRRRGIRGWSQLRVARGLSPSGRPSGGIRIVGILGLAGFLQLRFRRDRAHLVVESRDVDVLESRREKLVVAHLPALDVLAQVAERAGGFTIDDKRTVRLALVLADLVQDGTYLVLLVGRVFGEFPVV